MFLKISQYSQENICAEVFYLMRSQASRPAKSLKRGSDTGEYSEIFLWIFRKKFKTAFFMEYLRWLLLWLHFPWEHVTALVAVFWVGCFAILNPYSAVYFHWLALFFSSFSFWCIFKSSLCNCSKALQFQWWSRLQVFG